MTPVSELLESKETEPSKLIDSNQSCSLSSKLQSELNDLNKLDIRIPTHMRPCKTVESSEEDSDSKSSHSIESSIL